MLYNPEKSYTSRIGKHKPCRFSIVKKSQLTDIRKKKVVIGVKILSKNIVRS